MLAEVGCCLISQTETIAPADKKLYALRDVTATVESLPLICASVMSKKLAEGSDALVLDVKCGRGAFMKPPRTPCAGALAGRIGTAAGVRTEAFVTRMDAPLGRAVGNALEIAECIEVLKGKGPPDLDEDRHPAGGAHGPARGKAATRRRGRGAGRDALASGAALDELRAMIAGRAATPPWSDDAGAAAARRSRHADHGRARRLSSRRSMPMLVGRAAVALGAGRDKKDDAVDPAAGIMLLKKPGDAVSGGDRAGACTTTTARGWTPPSALAKQAVVIGDTAPPEPAAGHGLGARRRRDEVRCRDVRRCGCLESPAAAGRAGRDSRPRLRAVDQPPRHQARIVAWGLGLQVLFALLVLKTAQGQWMFELLGDKIRQLLDFSTVGSAFVFGPLGDRAVWARVMTGALGSRRARSTG